MRFERMIRLTMLAGVAWALPAAAPMAIAAGVPARSAPQSADAYQWIDRADALWDAIGDAPPDTAFAFEGQEPWAWQMSDGHTVIVEDAGAEGIRSYYFAPGATGPFLAVEPGMSFAFEGGRLAMVYDADGEAAPRAEFGDYSDAALDLYARGRRLYQALAGRDYRPVDTGAWIDASPYIFGFIQLWDEGRSRYPDWRRYHARSDSAAWRRRFEAEQRRRREQALRFSHWRQGGFQGPPPGRFHTPGQPGRPGTGRPPQPGSGGSRPGGGGSWGQPGRPGRPGGPGTPGTNPPPRPGTPQPPIATPGNPTPPPLTRPRPDRPDGTPGWRRGRPGTPPVPAPVPVTVPDAGAPTPPVPQPDARPPRPRPEGGWRPRPTTPPSSGAAPTPPVFEESQPVPRPRPGGWGSRPTPPSSGASPTPPVTGNAPPAPRPRPEGGWRPRPAPSGGAPDASPAPQFRPRPTPPSVSAPTPRPSYTPPAPSASPPPSRPSYTPPAPSRPSYTPPASRPAPPPRKMSPDDPEKF